MDQPATEIFTKGEEKKMILESSDNFSFSILALNKFRICHPEIAVSETGSFASIPVESYTLE